MLARLGLGNRHQEKLLPQGTRPGQPQDSGSQCLRRAAVAHRHHCPCSGSWQPGGLEEAPTPPARPPANTPRRVRVKGRVPTISSQVSGTPEALEGGGPGGRSLEQSPHFRPKDKEEPGRRGGQAQLPAAPQVGPACPRLGRAANLGTGLRLPPGGLRAGRGLRGLQHLLGAGSGELSPPPKAGVWPRKTPQLGRGREAQGWGEMGPGPGAGRAELKEGRAGGWTPWCQGATTVPHHHPFPACTGFQTRNFQSSASAGRTQP